MSKELTKENQVDLIAEIVNVDMDRILDINRKVTDAAFEDLMEIRDLQKAGKKDQINYDGEYLKDRKSVIVLKGLANEMKGKEIIMQKTKLLKK